ncbi:hypothetical protein ABAZ39_18860 (plasmid) [Azospirillum argentinense]|uniref:Uncharacterized protein n=1 Tax=Azospirillum argentinense TaxID=2970906 RepID=A0A060DS58_9PROT|nr:hypothetical protein [Azospirillum argentinense]AIB13993.1 hypothetical protein ABAZ39_18860 [Azospirillum argentinense]EZQ06495.1 hypothetical protein ABAZ39_19240 [Azospirillum argentinense]
MGAVHFLTNGRGAQHPAGGLHLQRLPMGAAVDWQAAVMMECRRQGALSPGLFAYLERAGLLERCTFLASDGAADPLRFRYLGAPTRNFFGRGWARQMAGRPDQDDPHHVLAEGFAAEYLEAMEGGVPVLNRVVISGLSAAPLVYQHALIGWKERTGRRAVLCCMHVPAVAGQA